MLMTKLSINRVSWYYALRIIDIQMVIILIYSYKGDLR